jgi:hypothetical protein
MDSDGSKDLIAIVVMILPYAALVFSKTRKSSMGAKK